MQVLDRLEGTKVAYHMGRSQPKHATGYCVGQASWSRTIILMQAFTSSTCFMVYYAMALHKLTIHAAPSHTSVALWIVVLCVSLSYSISEPKSVPFLGSRVFQKRWALVPGAYNLVGVLFPSQSGHSLPCF